MATTEITHEEIADLSEKLQTFAQELSPGQQALLGMILAKAVEAGGEDVEGHHWADPTQLIMLHHTILVDWDFLQFHLQGIMTHLDSLHHITHGPWSGALTE